MVMALLYEYVRPRIWKTTNTDVGRSTLVEVSWGAWRVRTARYTADPKSGDTMMRNYDFDNFNIRHTLLTMILGTLVHSQAIAGPAGEAFLSRRDIAMAGMAYWIANDAARETTR